MTDILSAASTLLMHTGSRHLTFDLTAAQRKVINRPSSKVLIMFAMFYMSTRSILWSAVLIGVYFLGINMLLNEGHPLNVFSIDWLKKEGFATGDIADTKNLYKENLRRLP